MTAPAAATRLTPDEFWKLKERVRAERVARAESRRARVTVHLGTCGIASGAGKVLDRLRTALRAAEADDVEVVSSGCAGLCSREPMVTVETADHPPAKYADVDPGRMARIVEEHVLGGQIVRPLLLCVGSEAPL